MALNTKQLAKKTSKTMLGAQRRDLMESRRLQQQLQQLQEQRSWSLRGIGREQRQAEQQQNLSNILLSDDVISVDSLCHGRPRAPSAAQRARDAFGSKPRQRRPTSVFRSQIQRQQQQQQQQQDGSSAKASCQYAGSDSSCSCQHFPCCLPQTYSFLGNKREQLRLYELVLHQLPEHRRPQSAASDTSDLSSLISDAEFLVAEQSSRSAADPVERARLLKQAAAEWRRKHQLQLPQPRETRYGKAYPMRTILKPITSSASNNPI